MAEKCAMRYCRGRAEYSVHLFPEYNTRGWVLVCTKHLLEFAMRLVPDA